MAEQNPCHRHVDENCSPRCAGRIKPARRATDRQSAPTGNGDVVLDTVLAVVDDIIRIRDSGPAGRENALRRVYDDLEARAEMGKAKYGTYLRTHNGRSARLDLYQEILDGIMYAAQANLEGDTQAGALLYPLLEFARQLTKER